MGSTGRTFGFIFLGVAIAFLGLAVLIAFAGGEAAGPLWAVIVLFAVVGALILLGSSISSLSGAETVAPQDVGGGGLARPQSGGGPARRAAEGTVHEGVPPDDDLGALKRMVGALQAELQEMKGMGRWASFCAMASKDGSMRCVGARGHAGRHAFRRDPTDDGPEEAGEAD